MRFPLRSVLLVVVFSAGNLAADPIPGDCLLRELGCAKTSFVEAHNNRASRTSPGSVRSAHGRPNRTEMPVEARDSSAAGEKIALAKVQTQDQSAARARKAGPTNDRHLFDKRTKQSGKACYFWFETNTQKYLNKFIRHHQDWKSTGSPIITARIGNVRSYTKRLADAGIPVISGFKTSGALKNRPFHDRRAWEKIARVAREVSALTGGKPVVLENEGTVTRMISNGTESIDYEELVRSLSAQDWPEIWFWYAPAGQREPVRTVSRQIAYAIREAIPNSRLIEASSAGYPSSARNSNSRTNLKSTLAVDNDPISIIYLDDEQTSFWPLKDTNLAVKSAYGRTVVVYPGFADIENASLVEHSMNRDTACQNTDT